MALTKLTALQVTFKLGAVGAVLRSLFSKLNDTVSVKDFGAVGDGAVDDTAAFTAALARNPESVLVPVATYVVNAAISGKFHSFGIVTISGTGSVTITNLVP